MKEALYNKIASIGPYWSKSMHILSNGGDAYLVHLYGGVFFELIKDEDGVYLEVHWCGPLLRADAVDILAWMTILIEAGK